MNLVGWLVAGPFMYLAITVFVGAAAWKIFKIARLPRHLRWDLYPIAHEGKAGSMYQEVDYWKKPRHFSLVHEILEMAEEIILLKRTFLYNRKIWRFSFPMHFAFYLVCGWIGLLILGVLYETITGIKISPASSLAVPILLNYLTLFCGGAGLLIGLFGTVGLLLTRLTDEDLADFSAPVTFLNLAFIGLLFGVGLLYWLMVDPAFALARDYVGALLLLHPMTEYHPLMVLEIFLFGLFLIYLPFSRMLHFAAKYFFYHSIMWDDELVARGSALEKEISQHLADRIDWEGPHIVPGSSWAEQATTNPTRPAAGGEKA